MKKILLFASALAGLFLAGSCQRENLEPAAQGGVTYEITLPDGPQTKGEAGYGVYNLHYEVYKTANADALATAPLLFEKTVEMTGNKTTLTLDLLNDQDYTVLFWANKKGGADFDLTDLRKVGVKTPIAANNDDRDAFCGMDQLVQHDGAQSKTVELKRPFAQINIATLVPTKEDIGYDVTPTHSYVKVSSIPMTFNVFTGLPVGNTTAVEFSTADAPAKIPSDDITVNGTAYDWVAMNYILVPESVVEVYYEITTANGIVKNTISNVPVKKNYRTNIIGNLLTSNATYTIEIKPGFEGDNYGDVEVINEGIVKFLNTGVYQISNAAGLAYASQNLFAKVGGSYVLTEDIDMAGASSVVTKAAEGLTYNSAALTHKMTTESSFEFDGAGHTIKNLPGMFIAYTGSAKSVVVKNLTLETPNVAFNVADNPDTDGVGAFIGYAGTSTTITLDNCHVKGGKIEGGHWTGGLVGYAAGYSGNDGPVFETLTIKDCSVMNAEVTGKGSCGGIIGHATGDAWTLVDMDNIVVNSNSIISTGDSDNKAGSVMGTLGNAGQPKTVNGVTKTGGVTIDGYEVSGNTVKSNNVDNAKLWGRQGNSDGVLTIDGEKVEDFGNYVATTTVTVTNDAELAAAIEGALPEMVIKLASGTYNENIVLTVAELGAAKGDITFKAVAGAEPVITGTVTLGYREQGTGATMWGGNVTFEGITFDHANPATHSLDVQDVKSLTLKNCTIIGDGEYGLTSARGNATGTSSIVECTFENAGMQLLGNFATGLVIDNCTFEESCINVQAGNGVTVQNCTFNNTLKSVHVGDSFYCVRSNSTPISVKNCEINIDSELAEVASGQAKWGLLWNRGTTNWTVENVAVNLTQSALIQTELLVTKCTSTGTIDNNLTVNGVHVGVSQNAEGVWVVDTATGALSWLKANNPEVFQNGTVQYGTALYAYSNNGMNATLSPAGEDAKLVRYLIGATVKDVIVADGIKVIGDRTFRDAPNLASIVLPQSLTELEEGAFQQCGLTSITIPGENVTLGKQSIGYLPNLETITITAKKVTVGNYCARACTKLKSVYIYSDEITFAAGGSMYFTDCESNNTSGITFYVSSQAIADAVNAAYPNGHAKGMQIKSIDGTVTYYSR